MPPEPFFQYTHVEAGLVENVALRPTDDTETYPSGWKYTLHLGTLDDLTLVRYDNSHEERRGTSITPQPAISTASSSPGWKSCSSSSGRARTSTGTLSTATRPDHADRTPPNPPPPQP